MNLFGNRIIFFLAAQIIDEQNHGANRADSTYVPCRPQIFPLPSIHSTASDPFRAIASLFTPPPSPSLRPSTPRTSAHNAAAGPERETSVSLTRPAGI